MNVLLAALGSRGDIQPFRALGETLTAGGHHAMAVCEESAAEFVCAGGLPCIAVDCGDAPPLDVVMREAAEFSSASAKTQHLVERWLEPRRPALRDASIAVARNFDVIVAHGFLVRTISHSGAVLPPLVGATFGAMMPSEIVETGDYDCPIFVAVDPRFYRLPCAPGRLLSTGFWWLDESRSAPLRLDALMDEQSAGGGPVAVLAMGSMSCFDEVDAAMRFVEAARLSGLRAVVQALGSVAERLAFLADRCTVIGALPHAAVFSQSAVVMHHGGMGTIAAALRYGAASIVAPQLGDQSLNAELLAKTGTLCGSFPASGWNVDHLAASMARAVTSASVAEATRHWRNALSERNGAVEAAAILESMAAKVWT